MEGGNSSEVHLNHSFCILLVQKKEKKNPLSLSLSRERERQSARERVRAEMASFRPRWVFCHHEMGVGRLEGRGMQMMKREGKEEDEGGRGGGSKY